MHIYLPLCLPACLSVCLSACLPTHYLQCLLPSERASCLSIYLSIYLSNDRSVCLSINLSIHLYLHPSPYPFDILSQALLKLGDCMTCVHSVCRIALLVAIPLLISELPNRIGSAMAKREQADECMHACRYACSMYVCVYIYTHTHIHALTDE